MNNHGHTLRLSCLLLALMTMSNTTMVTSLDKYAGLCYAYAMIGMDSVINARLGMLPEELMELAQLDTLTATATPYYSIDLLQTVLNAYLWQDSPHDYALKVFRACNQQQI